MHTTEGERILVMAAINRPQELDDAALRYLYERKNMSGICTSHANQMPYAKTTNLLIQEIWKEDLHSIT